MFPFITSLVICLLPCTFGVTINAPTDKIHPKSLNNQEKRSLLIGDVSYSYSATDIGSEKGSHVKTVTVIKNIGEQKYHKHPYQPYDDWDSSSKNRFNFVFKFPEFPHIDTGTFFHTEKPRKVVPTKQPTDRQTPVFETEFNTDDFDDQPNVNVNNNNVPQVSEQSPETLPDAMTMVSTENPVADEVEYIQSDGDQSTKSTMPTPAMFHSKKLQSSAVSKSHGYRIGSTHGKTAGHKQLQGHRQSSDLIEDFSDYSMHNVKHLIDPMKVKDSLLKYTQNQPKIDVKKLTNIESTGKGNTFDSYGNVIQKSQSLLDASQSSPYKTNSESNTNAQSPKRPYISPSLKTAYTSPSQSTPKITTTTSSKGLIFFSTTQKAYVAPKKIKSSETPKPDKLVMKPSTESIQQPRYSLEINNDRQSEHRLNTQFQPSQKYQPQESYSPPLKQLNAERKPEQQFHSYSIRNPLTTSLPIQHNRQEPLKLKPKLQSYVSVPIEPDMPSMYLNEGSKQHLLTMPKRYVRHQLVFDSKPPHAFMESPFKPVKAILMG